MKYRHSAIIVKTYLSSLQRAADSLLSPPGGDKEVAEKAEAAAVLKQYSAGLPAGTLKTWLNKLLKEMVSDDAG